MATGNDVNRREFLATAALAGPAGLSVRPPAPEALRQRLGGGHAAHFDGNVPRLGTVIYVRKNMRMDIDHDKRNTATRAVLR